MPMIGYQSSLNLPPAVWDIWPHGVILVLLILLLFGGKKLPELAKGLARGLRIFRDEIHGVKSDLDDNGTKNLPPSQQQQQQQSKIEAKPQEPVQEKKDQ